MASMNLRSILQRKADNGVLTDEEVHFFVEQIHSGHVTDGLLAAFVTSVYCNGMLPSETLQLTKSMVEFSSKLVWPESWRHLVVDKHSTGGVGDKVSPILISALVACGAKVPMLSGRGLGHTGGTIDKMESINGFTSSISMEQMQTVVADVGGFIASQTETIAPVDRVMYAMRDTCGMVASIPLITASIMSKKAVEGISTLIMDVKYGSGAFMKTRSDAEKLAKFMKETGTAYGMQMFCHLNKMDTHSGRCVGNALEIAEVLQTLNGYGSADINELVTMQGGELLSAIGISKSAQAGKEKINDLLKNGMALSKFKNILVAQGVESSHADKICAVGNFSTKKYLEWLDKLPRCTTEVKIHKSGYVEAIDATVVAQLCLELGGGRMSADATIDKSVGIEFKALVGDHVTADSTFAEVFHSGSFSEEQSELLMAAVILCDKKPPIVPIRTGCM